MSIAISVCGRVRVTFATYKPCSLQISGLSKNVKHVGMVERIQHLKNHEKTKIPFLYVCQTIDLYCKTANMFHTPGPEPLQNHYIFYGVIHSFLEVQLLSKSRVSPSV